MQRLDVNKAFEALEAVEGLSFEPGAEAKIVVMNMADWQAALRLVYAALGGEKCERCHKRFPEPKLHTGYCDACCEALCACGHPLGVHFIGREGLEDCGYTCDCGAFDDAMLAAAKEQR